MNKHDQQRKDSLINTLLKAREKAIIARMYLTANERDPEDIADANLVLEHVDIALDRLGAAVPQ